MSHMKDLAIDEMNALNEKFFEEMRESDSYKFGYCRSAIATAIWLLELGKHENALNALKDCAEMMKDRPNAR